MRRRRPKDCDANGEDDDDEDGDGTDDSDPDDGDDIPDECDVDSTGGADCDANGEDDSCDKTVMAPLTRVTPMMMVMTFQTNATSTALVVRTVTPTVKMTRVRTTKTAMAPSMLVIQTMMRRHS